MKTLLRILPVLFLAVSMLSFAQEAPKDLVASLEVENVEAEVTINETMTLDTSVGIVQKTKTAECEYIILTLDRQRLLPVNLPSQFEKDGLPVQFTFTRLRSYDLCPGFSPIFIERIGLTAPSRPR